MHGLDAATDADRFDPTDWDTTTNLRSLSNSFGATLQTPFTPGDAVVETKDVWCLRLSPEPAATRQGLR